jgi:EAL domain-containing protein (putative c-di-GMP-specific phosphodiesterase class I)
VVHVNVTPTDLRRIGIAGQLVDGFNEMHLQPHRFVVEMTESDIFELDNVVRDNLIEMNDAGIRFAVDDFGTGFSSLSHLLDLPTDHLKIDRRFIADMLDDPAGHTLVRGVVGLAQGMGLLTVAEGVETEAQALSLAALGCSQLQGWLVAPAMPAAKAIAFSDQHALSLAR